VDGSINLFWWIEQILHVDEPVLLNKYCTLMNLFWWIEQILHVFRKIMISTASLGAQGRTEFRWRPGQETCLAPTRSNLRFFRSKCAVLKKVLVTLLELLGVPSDSTPGELCPLFRPSLRPCRGSCVKPEHGKLFQGKSLPWWTTSSEWVLLDFVLMLVSTCGQATWKRYLNLQTILLLEGGPLFTKKLLIKEVGHKSSS